MTDASNNPAATASHSTKSDADLIESPGLENIVAGQTAISTLAQGLSYRGYAVEELANHACFEEVVHLLLYGELPTAAELAAFTSRLHAAAAIPSPLVALLRDLPRHTNMMDAMRTSASVLAHFDAEAQDNSLEANRRKAERLAVQLPIAMAARHRLSIGAEPVGFDPKLSLAGNLMWMLFRREPTERMTRALNVSLVLYAEHEFNASAFAARVVSSTLSDLHSAITAAIGALKGPLHGGANERALAVVRQAGDPEQAEAWLRGALARKERIMGFGHRVYRDGDPRATYVRQFCTELAKDTGNESLEATADVIERIMREEKSLPPNVDWPTARMYFYLGLPVELYTPLFVVSRVVGWSAHVIEQLANNRLIRPRSRYVGPAAQPWKPIEQR